jgi:ATP-binding cassette subfamily B protein
MSARPNRRRRFVPEVIQTSKVDCGPATLKAMLAGFGIPVGYARLREACQTDVDGTSVDRLTQIAGDLGLDVEQVIVPVDHVVVGDSPVLPGIAVVSSPAGDTHLVVLWKMHGARVQVMDPARGRLWMSRRALVQQLYVHKTAVPAAAWREWAGTDEFLAPVRARLSAIGLSRREQDARIADATADPSWRSLAALDAAIRLIATLRESKALRRSDVAAAIDTFTHAAHNAESPLPPQCWSVLPTESGPDGEEQVVVRGAIVLRAIGPRAGSFETASRSAGGPERSAPHIGGPERSALHACTNRVRHFSPALAGVLHLVRDNGRITYFVIAAAMAIAVVGMTFEVLLLRGVLDLGTSLRVPEQRLMLMAALVMFSGALLGAEWILAAAERRLGSHLEARLRIALLDKIPQLADRYFQSRPTSDMAERSHSVHTLRLLPSLAIRCLRTLMELMLTTAAIVWLDPSIAAVAVVGAIVTAAIPLVGHSFIAERDLRHRTHSGALARFHLDALLGRTAIDAHHAGAVVEREHDQLLGQWANAGASLHRAVVAVEGLQITIGFAVAVWLIVSDFGHRADTGAMLLLVYWALNLPALGYELALHIREYPAHRSTILRLLEPLEEADHIDPQAQPLADPRVGASTGVEIELRDATVAISDQTILERVTTHIPAGSHLAIVGSSGAGKSTLVSLLLGWHPLAQGEALIDGRPLDAAAIADLRQRTAWVDPTVQIWNRTLFDNLLYGSDPEASIGEALESAELLPVLSRLPDGLATSLGEGGTLLSAGEAQRVRLGRVLMRHDPALVLLDEPFRGLERERRRMLVARVRERWPNSTVLYITHDIAEAGLFDRVLVIERGRLVEDGDPVALAQRPSSRYRRMLHAQEALHARFGATSEWRRIRFDSGQIAQQGADVVMEQTA